MSTTELQSQVDELQERLSHTDAKLRSKLDYLLKEVQKLRALMNTVFHELNHRANSPTSKPCCKKKSQ